MQKKLQESEESLERERQATHEKLSGLYQQLRGKNSVGQNDARLDAMKLENERLATQVLPLHIPKEIFSKITT